MIKYLLFLSLIVTSANLQASPLIHNDQATDQRNCFSRIFTDYDSWRNGMERKFRHKHDSEDAVAKALSRFDDTFSKEAFYGYKSRLSCRTFKYVVDGHTVNGYVIKPKQVSNNLPVLVYNRGGNGNYGRVVFGAMMKNLFPIADEGFVIIGSQYRGTYNKLSAVQDEFGGKDVSDVTTLFSLVPHIEGADPAKVGMFGASRGGMQTFLTLKEATHIKAVATIAGNSDLLTGLSYRPQMEKVYENRIPDYAKNKIAELKKRSVLQWVDQLPGDVPILLLHGSNDKRVSVKHSIALAKALDKNNRPHKLVIYPEDDHWLSRHKAKATRELVGWFKAYL